MAIKCLSSLEANPIQSRQLDCISLADDRNFSKSSSQINFVNLSAANFKLTEQTLSLISSEIEDAAVDIAGSVDIVEKNHEENSYAIP